MSSSPYASSLGAESVRSSLLAQIPRRYELVEIRSDTNSTMTGILGPGRIVGTMISRAGRRLERAVDRFAEERLGLGPNQDALRLTSTLHDIHVSKSPECRSDHVLGLNTSEYVTHRLIWVCNGYCSHCYSPYLPQVLDELSEGVLKAIQQLIKHLQASRPIANIGFACVYVRLLVQSNVLVASLFKRLGVLDTLKNTRNLLWPSHSSYNNSSDELAALKHAMTAIERVHEDKSIGHLVRFPLYVASKWEEELETLNEYISCFRNSKEWGAREIASAQLLTWISGLALHNSVQLARLEREHLMTAFANLKLSARKLDYDLVGNATSVFCNIAATYVSSTALILTGHNSKVYSVAWSPDCTQLISGSGDQTVCVSEANTGRQVASLEGHTKEVKCVAVSPNGAMFASGSDDMSIRLWDAGTGNSITVLQGHTARLWSVAFSPDGAQVASASGDHTIRLWDTKTGLESRTLIGHTEEVILVAYSPDGCHLASGSNDTYVRLWNVRTGQQTAILSGQSYWVWSVAFSPDGMCIASGSVDRIIRFWDATTGRETSKLNGHNDSVRSVAFSPDGKHLVSGSYDRTVRLWDVETGRQIAVLRGHGGFVMTVAFSPDGNYVASGSDDQTIRVWDVSILRASYGGSRAPLQAQAEEVELGVI